MTATTPTAADFLAMCTPAAMQAQQERYAREQAQAREERSHHRKLRGHHWQLPATPPAVQEQQPAQANQKPQERPPVERVDYHALTTPEAQQAALERHQRHEQQEQERGQQKAEKYRKFKGEQAAPPPENPFIGLQDALKSAQQGEQITIRTRTPPVPREQAQQCRQHPELPPLVELLDLEGLRPKRGRGAGGAGAGQLAEVLHLAAAHVMQARRYAVLPSQITLHLPQELLAAHFAVNRSTVWRWTQRLTELGHIEAREHYTTMTTPDGPQTVVDGMLYAIRTRPGHTAHLHFDDLAHQYRDLDADREAGRTAYSILLAIGVKTGKNFESVKMQQSKTSHETELTLKNILTWAVTPGEINLNPVKDNDCCIFPATPGEAVSAGLEAVANDLPQIDAADQCSRPQIINQLATRLVAALADDSNRAAWAGKIWDAYQAGRVQGMAAQITRLAADVDEWDGWHNPAALLMSRLTTCPPALAETPATFSNAAD